MINSVALVVRENINLRRAFWYVHFLENFHGGTTIAV